MRIASGWAWPAGDDDDGDGEDDDAGEGDEAEVWILRRARTTAGAPERQDDDDAGQRTSPRGKLVRAGATKAIQLWKGSHSQPEID